MAMAVVAVSPSSSSLRSTAQHRFEALRLLLVEDVADDVHPLGTMGREELVALGPVATEALGELGHLLVGQVEAAPQELQSPARASSAATTSEV